MKASPPSSNCCSCSGPWFSTQEPFIICLCFETWVFIEIYLGVIHLLHQLLFDIGLMLVDLVDNRLEIAEFRLRQIRCPSKPRKGSRICRTWSNFKEISELLIIFQYLCSLRLWIISFIKKSYTINTNSYFKASSLLVSLDWASNCTPISNSWFLYKSQGQLTSFKNSLF